MNVLNYLFKTLSNIYIYIDLIPWVDLHCTKVLTTTSKYTEYSWFSGNWFTEFMEIRVDRNKINIITGDWCVTEDFPVLR